MSRSRRKTPIIGNCADSEKDDKRKANRALRRITNIAVRQHRDVLPIRNEVSSAWDMAKDGKSYFGTYASRAKLLRK